MEDRKQFSTYTDQRWQIAHDTAFFLAGGCGGMCVIPLGYLKAGLIVLGYSLFAALTNAFFIVCRKSIHLTFTGSSLLISHPRRADQTIADIPARHFVCRQNFLERKFNVGRIRIRNTQVDLYGVQNYAETCRYIRENFPDF